jgi:hypothetical protein
MWRLIYGVPSWILFELCIDIPLMLAGWIVVPIAAACGAYTIDVKMVGDSKSTGQAVKTAHFTWRWMWLWDNEEDGIANDTYWKAPNMFQQIVYWSCIRNSTNNVRFVPYLNVMIDPAKVGFRGTIDTGEQWWTFEHIPGEEIPKEGSVDWSEIKLFDTKCVQWFFAWQGFYSCWYWQFLFRGSMRRLWIGWKIYPTDIYGVTEYRKNGAGFGIQFKAVT